VEIAISEAAFAVDLEEQVTAFLHQKWVFPDGLALTEARCFVVFIFSDAEPGTSRAMSRSTLIGTERAS
jgi:hypothetical protein